MESLKLTIPGEPMAVQSMKVARAGKFIRKYQPKAVVNWKAYIRTYIATTLPDGWEPLRGALFVKYTFVFPILKSASKRTKEAIRCGEKVYKATRPDLSDNLKKGLNDALNGLVWNDDSQIAKEKAEKIYGDVPRIEIVVREGLRTR